MPNELTKKYFEKDWPLELYKLTSFLISLIIWPAFYYSEPDFFSHAHFISIFTIGNAYFYYYTFNLGEYLKETNQYPFYFLFQFVSLVGISYSHHEPSFLYMAVMPILMTLYYFSIADQSFDSFSQRKPLFVYSMGFCSFLIFEAMKGGEFLTYSEAISLSSFALWIFMTAYWGFELYFRGKKRLLSKLFNIEEDRKNPHDTKGDRHFFHDIINHTHALLLFLNTKKEKESVSNEDIGNVINEIRLLQDQIQQHFGFIHKDLKLKASFVPFQLALGRVYNLLDAYFPSSKNVTINLLGKLNDTNLDNIRSCTVDITSFHRIMTNILKNASESGSDWVSIDFDYQEEGLFVRISNSVSDSLDSKRDIALDLKKKISRIDERRDHVGLESISKICHEVGGSFSFKIEAGQFINEFFLPHEKSNYDINKQAA